jgi:hypothetical protein
MVLGACMYGFWCSVYEVRDEEGPAGRPAAGPAMAVEGAAALAYTLLRSWGFA